MKNCKRDAAYRAIDEAVREVNRSRTFRNRETPERADLDRTVLLLEEISWKIVAEDIAASSARMAAAAKELRGLARSIDRKNKRLKAVAAAIRKAADAAARAASLAVKVI